MSISCHLRQAYARCGVRGRPKIGVPGNTRMVVYSSCFLAQSFRHFSARYHAVLDFSLHARRLSEVADARSRNRHKKKHEKLNRVGVRMADAGMLARSLLTHQCLNLPHGFIAGALRVQSTCLSLRCQPAFVAVADAHAHARPFCVRHGAARDSPSRGDGGPRGSLAGAV